MIVSYTQTLFYWIVENHLLAATIIFGGGMIAVMLYTYVYDYRILAKRG